MAFSLFAKVCTPCAFTVFPKYSTASSKKWHLSLFSWTSCSHVRFKVGHVLSIWFAHGEDVIQVADYLGFPLQDGLHGVVNTTGVEATSNGSLVKWNNLCGCSWWLALTIFHPVATADMLRTNLLWWTSGHLWSEQTAWLLIHIQVWINSDWNPQKCILSHPSWGLAQLELPIHSVQIAILH